MLRSIAVAVLTGESGLATIKETLARIGRAAGIDPATVTRLIISDRIPHLASFEHLDAIRQLILDYQLELLAIDPAYLALDGTDAANVMIFGQQLRAVSELCQELGVALLLCHHTRKGSGVDHQPLSLTDVAWAGFAEHCRQWLLVNHRERYDHASRDPSALVVGWRIGWARRSLGHGRPAGPHIGCWWASVERDHSKCRTSPATGRRAKRSRKRGSTSRTARNDKQTVHNTLAKFPQGESKTVMRDTSGLHSTRFNIALSALLADGRRSLVTFLSKAAARHPLRRIQAAEG